MKEFDSGLLRHFTDGNRYPSEVYRYDNAYSANIEVLVIAPHPKWKLIVTVRLLHDSSLFPWTGNTSNGPNSEQPGYDVSQ